MTESEFKINHNKITFDSLCPGEYFFLGPIVQKETLWRKIGPSEAADLVENHLCGGGSHERPYEAVAYHVESGEFDLFDPNDLIIRVKKIKFIIEA